MLPAYIALRFHKEPLEELAKSDKFLATFEKLAGKPFQGVYRCPLVKLAAELNVKPFTIPRILYSI